MSAEDVSAGLVLPYAAVALLGKGGAIATLLIVFMAVTSATSSELIAVSSICTYDLYVSRPPCARYFMVSDQVKLMNDGDAGTARTSSPMPAASVSSG